MNRLPRVSKGLYSAIIGQSPRSVNAFQPTQIMVCSRKGNRKADNMKRTGIAILAAVAMGVLGTLYEQAGELGLSTTARLALKGTTTLMAALLAAYGAMTGGGTPAWLICAGIVVCAAADVLLEKVFFVGMGCFALGHALYIAAFLMMKPVRTLNIAVFVALAITAVAVVYALRKRLNPAMAYLLYGLIISAMAALSLGQKPVAAVGAFLFLASDIVLAFRLAGVAPAIWGRVVLLCYYGGQYLLGLSTLFT